MWAIETNGFARPQSRLGSLDLSRVRLFHRGEKRMHAVACDLRFGVFERET